MAALNFTTASASKPLFGNNHNCPKPNFFPRTKDLFKLNCPCPPSLYSLRSAIAAAQSEGTVSEEERENYSDSDSTTAGSFPSARARLNLLEQLTSSSAGSSTADQGYESDYGAAGKRTIREQLAQLVGDRDDDFSIPLGKNLKKVSPKFLTTSQKRNIRRQTYLNEVSQRNDSVFFATIGAFVILPPIVILGIAILTGYVQLFP